MCSKEINDFLDFLNLLVRRHLSDTHQYRDYTPSGPSAHWHWQDLGMDFCMGNQFPLISVGKKIDRTRRDYANQCWAQPAEEGARGLFLVHITVKQC